MAENMQITSPVKVVPDSHQRVAFDLMKTIADYDGETKDKKKHYWLKLYRQCYKATYGYPIERILEESD